MVELLNIMDKREERILKTIKEFSKKLPRFSDGRIDYSNTDLAPSLTVFVKHEDNILLLKRSDKILAYKGKWSTVAGYLDELKPIREKILEEAAEEIGLTKNDIMTIHIGRPFRFTDREINKIWLCHPCLIELKKKPNIKIDWEHTEYRWIKKEELKEFDIVPGLDKSLEEAFR